MIKHRCSTDHAIFLLAVTDAQGLLRFPQETGMRSLGELYGIRVPIEPLLPIDPQLLDKASDIIGVDIRLHCEIFQDFADECVVSPEENVTIFLGKIFGLTINPREDWLSLPEILKQLPRDRRRLPYLRAMQILTGALSLETKVVDAEEILKHLK